VTATHDVVVIGGGIVGAACAFTLRQHGFAVLLIDRGEPQRAASWGNAGHFAYEQILPLASPTLWRDLPRLLFGRQSPLSIPLRSLWTLAPWVARFLWNTRPSQLERATAALASLLTVAPEAWRRLADAADLQALIRTGPILVVAQDAEALSAKRPVMEVFRRHGISVEETDPSSARAIEPMLRPDIAGAFVYPRAQYTIDPAALTRKLVEAFIRTGGALVDDHVSSVQLFPGGLVSIAGRRARWTARQAVIASGLGSRAILQSLGIRVPLAAERGYHLMIPHVAGRQTVRVPLIGARPEFVITPMAQGVRLAGTVELARSEVRPHWARATMLGKLAERLVGPLAGLHDASAWMGCRPTLPDSLPAVGRIPGAPEIIAAFGHQHLGLTLAAITGELVASIARREHPAIELAPFSLSRF
jgi:D-amino-acid dehydrogenase